MLFVFPLTIPGSHASISPTIEGSTSCITGNVWERERDNNYRVQRCPLLELTAQKFELKCVSVYRQGHQLKNSNCFRYISPKKNILKAELSLSQKIRAQDFTAPSP